MKTFKQHFSLMDNRFYHEEIVKTIIEKNRDKIKSLLKEFYISNVLLPLNYVIAGIPCTKINMYKGCIFNLLEI